MTGDCDEVVVLIEAAIVLIESSILLSLSSIDAGTTLLDAESVRDEEGVASLTPHGQQSQLINDCMMFWRSSGTCGQFRLLLYSTNCLQASEWQ